MQHHGPVEAVGVATQRASSVVWDRATGQPLAPGLGWQDLRTVGDCLVLQADGLRFAPNQSATKFTHLLGLVDPDRSKDLCIGTVDSWIIWTLTEGAAHVTDVSNAAVTGLMHTDGSTWDANLLDRLSIPRSAVPTLVDSSGPIAPATALPGAPMICGLAGDQQASLIGQSCVAPGPAKITFGTGGMLESTLMPRPSESTSICWKPSRPLSSAATRSRSTVFCCSEISDFPGTNAMPTRNGSRSTGIDMGGNGLA
jgi:glycerol kinase